MNRRRILLIIVMISIIIAIVDNILSLGIADVLNNFLVVFIVLGVGLSILGVKQ